MKTRLVPLCLAAAFAMSASAQAADWSDTSISWRAGNKFAEPFNPQDIKKNIFALTHASGYKYGSNFFNVDLLQSDENDPGSLTQDEGAQEAYVVYRHTVDFGKVRGSDIKFGKVRGVGATFGFDWNAKNDVGYNSRKRMLVAGPTLMWDVPGFLNTSILVLHESNAPSGAFAPISNVNGRYTYDVHPMFNAAWGIPLSERVSFEGYLNWIASKGKDEVGNDTGVETNIDMQVMYDVGTLMGYAKNKFRIGIEYQYWRNKFGNTAATTGGNGYVAKTPMVRAEYHF
ncbi:outer envelope protein [Massilia sp. GCM10020059]|uniref:Outer envelope protein n=1 Tax=Massilia agrisoli TaxID=2892444 RepID=A0ABS8IPG0_9BURK|nr:outer envelope protein [Massilia agrisoli]MCC6070260.1 outer envelope protein [Massilia agrisoli]